MNATQSGTHDLGPLQATCPIGDDGLTAFADQLGWCMAGRMVVVVQDLSWVADRNRYPHLANWSAGEEVHQRGVDLVGMGPADVVRPALHCD